jgi:hypothetical protein
MHHCKLLGKYADVVKEALGRCMLWCWWLEEKTCKCGEAHGTVT